MSSPGSFRSDDAIDADVDETGFTELFSIRAANSRSLSRRSVKPSSIEVEYPSEELRLCLRFGWYVYCGGIGSASSA